MFENLRSDLPTHMYRLVLKAFRKKTKAPFKKKIRSSTQTNNAVFDKKFSAMKIGKNHRGSKNNVFHLFFFRFMKIDFFS